jgi:hypothetical protein
MSDRTYKNQFPSELFTLDVAIPAGWEDSSWGNNICPSWDVPHCGLTVWIDFDKVDDREFLQDERFTITGNGECVATDSVTYPLTFNDWADVLAYIVGYEIKQQHKCTACELDKVCHFYRITFHADEPEGTDDAYLCVECEMHSGWHVSALPEPAA